ncbi:hypothetical protein D9613_009363 [Agrocybe pediades]|uniref:Uncharacterized protein n=1 Tax=Agrocybe pediades TaxID=84607 RepID=A0A8H4VVT7_9AGAR|nr:hypothetical protein D9613_009363 [Agrocybe pediades]
MLLQFSIVLLQLFKAQLINLFPNTKPALYPRQPPRDRHERGPHPAVDNFEDDFIKFIFPTSKSKKSKAKGSKKPRVLAAAISTESIVSSTIDKANKGKVAVVLTQQVRINIVASSTAGGEGCKEQEVEVVRTEGDEFKWLEEEMEGYGLTTDGSVAEDADEPVEAIDSSSGLDEDKDGCKVHSPKANESKTLDGVGLTPEGFLFSETQDLADIQELEADSERQRLLKLRVREIVKKMVAMECLSEEEKAILLSQEKPRK